MLIRSRRDFIKTTLRSATAFSAIGGLAKFGELNSYAAGSGYQALVCIFLAGGNDGHNTVVPITTAKQNYSAYQQARGGLAIAQNTLLPIANGADTYGLHPNMPEVQSLYNQGKAAILANVGMLVQPLTRQLYQSNNGSIIPSQLFSHSDQTGQWQTAIPTGLGSTGWGGRITDALFSSDQLDGRMRTVLHRRPDAAGFGSPRAVWLVADRDADARRTHVGPQLRHAATADVRQRNATRAGREQHHEPRSKLRDHVDEPAEDEPDQDGVSVR
jgi:uncharacterized protein (DUF1501 family)